jgi:hypothetical protein
MQSLFSGHVTADETQTVRQHHQTVTISGENNAFVASSAGKKGLDTQFLRG